MMLLRAQHAARLFARLMRAAYNRKHFQHEFLAKGSA
jgi:hypothetical protein